MPALGVGIEDWLAACRDDLVPGIPLGGWGDAPVVDPRSWADLDHVALGTACLLVGSTFLLLGIANPLNARTLGIVAALLVRVAFLLLGVAALLLGDR